MLFRSLLFALLAPHTAGESGLLFNLEAQLGNAGVGTFVALGSAGLLVVGGIVWPRTRTGRGRRRYRSATSGARREPGNRAP